MEGSYESLIELLPSKHSFALSKSEILDDLCRCTTWGCVCQMIAFKSSLICKHFQNFQSSLSCSGRWQMVPSEWTEMIIMVTCCFEALGIPGVLKGEEKKILWDPQQVVSKAEAYLSRKWHSWVSKWVSQCSIWGGAPCGGHTLLTKLQELWYVHSWNGCWPCKMTTETNYIR